MSDGRAFNSTLRSVSKKKQAAIDSGAYKRAPRKPMKAKAATNEGWYNWAVENVWNKREHKCEVWGIPLGDEPSPINFSHLLPRGSYRKYKLDERNLVIKCPAHHHQWHAEGAENLKDVLEWKPTCDLYFQLRSEANGL